MGFSEKLYALRRKSGLSQEQLAEQLNVSRQAISKWESGRSLPESDKLLAISRYFHVSLDVLMREDKDEPGAAPGGEAPVRQRSGRVKWALGWVFCVGGIVCLLLWGILSVADPATASRMSESSTVRLDGGGIFLLLCIAAAVFGAVLLAGSASKK